jgi:hypothetical protein
VQAAQITVVDKGVKTCSVGPGTHELETIFGSRSGLKAATFAAQSIVHAMARARHRLSRVNTEVTQGMWFWLTRGKTHIVRLRRKGMEDSGTW